MGQGYDIQFWSQANLSSNSSSITRWMALGMLPNLSLSFIACKMGTRAAPISCNCREN